VTKNLQIVAFAAVAILSVIIALLDLIGALNSIDWLKERIVTMTLLGVGVVAGFLAHRAHKIDEIENSLERSCHAIIESLGGVYTRELHNAHDYYEYLSTRLRQAKNSVDDLTWGVMNSTRRTEATDAAFKKYRQAIAAACKRKDIAYREVITLPDAGRVSRIEDTINADSTYYSLKYYDWESRELPPMLQFMIIDSKEVILGTHRGIFIPLDDESYVVIKHPAISRYFKDYFNTIWIGAKPIKDLDSLNTEIIEHFRGVDL